MKRICVLFLAVIPLLGACTAAPSVQPAAAQITGAAQTEQPTQALTATATPEATAAPTATPTATAAKGSFSADDLVFVLDGQTFPLKSDIAPLLNKLGKDYKLSEAVSCVYKGMDRTFEYPGISIYTFPVDNVDYMDEIVLTDGTYKTPKGVAAGGTLEDIVAAYGDGYYDDNGLIVYSTGSDPADLKSPRLYFVMEDGKIASIGFYSASNIR